MRVSREGIAFMGAGAIKGLEVFLHWPLRFTNFAFSFEIPFFHFNMAAKMATGVDRL